MKSKTFWLISCVCALRLRGGSDDHLFSAFPHTHFCPRLYMQANHSMIRAKLLGAYVSLLVWGKLKSTEKGLFCTFLQQQKTRYMIPGCIFFLNKSTDLQWRPFFVSAHWNKCCHRSIYWRTSAVLPEESEKKSLYIQVPSTSYKNRGERRLIYGVTWLHFTALWHWGRGGREDASFVCRTATADNDRGVWSTGMSLL